MLALFEAPVLRLLRVPAEPNPPAGEPGSLKVFRAARGYLRYRQLVWGLKQLSALVALVLGFVFLTEIAPNFRQLAGLMPVWKVAEVVAWVVFLVQLPFSYALLQLDYRLRWYMVTDRSLRVREGLLTLREKTMTFANIQQLTVEQGPLQRLLGLADVKVVSAGGGAAHAKDTELGSESAHEARFRGVSNAAEIRDLVRDRVKRFRDAGLGDTDDAPELSGDAPAVTAANELLAEVRALRSALATRS